jgi:hypothetical protein
LEDIVDRDSLKLDYLSKLHATLLETGKAVNRDILWCTSLSIVIIVLSSGLAVADSQITLVGLKLALPVWFVPFCAAWLLTFMYVHLWGLTNHDDRLLKTILRLYRELGLDDAGLQATEVSPLELPNLVTVIGSKQNLPLGRASLPLGALLASAIALLPPVAQVFLACRMLMTHGPKWWLILAFLFMLSFMIFFFVAFVHGMGRRDTTEPSVPGDA